MTGAQIVGWVRDKLGDTSFDQQEILDAANWFVNSLFFNTQTRLMEESDTLFASAGDSTVDLPDDYQTIIVDSPAVVSPQIYSLKNYHMQYGDFMKQFPGYNAPSTQAQALAYWTTFSNTMRFSAPLLADTQINVDYCRLPVDMASTTSTCEVPDQYTELVVEGTLARCMQTNEDYPEASQELANNSPLVTAFIRREARGAQVTGPVIIRNNRRRGGIRRSPFGW